MFDGFGLDYLAQSDMPTLRGWQRDGLYKHVRGIMPSVTNANNSSICCRVFPKEHGITGNSYFDPRTGHEEYMETADLLLAPTLFEHAAKVGVSSALISSKKKTISLLSKGANIPITPEEAPAEWVERLGPVPGVYSREINYGRFSSGHRHSETSARDPVSLCAYHRLSDAYLGSGCPGIKGASEDD